MATAETARLIASLELQDKNFTRGLKNVERGVNRVDRKLGAVSGAVNRNVARGIDTLISKGGEFLTGTIKDATEFETAFTGVAKTVTGDISGIKDELKTLSTEIPLTVVELAGIAELGGAMGIAKEDLIAFTEQVAILGTTTNVSTEDAATALGQLSNVLGLTADEYDNFSAALVDLGNKGASTEAQILKIAKRAGGAASLIGVAKDATLGWASAAANLGLGEELAGTALQKFFLTTQTLVTSGGAKLEKLADISGMTAKQFKKAWEKDATGALTGFIAGLSDLTKGQRVAAIQKLFGKREGLTRLLIGLADSFDENLTPSLETSTEAWDEATAAQVEAEKKFKTSESLFKRLDNSVKIVSATIGEALLPVLNDLATEGIEFLNKPGTQRGIKNFASSIGKGVRSLAKIITSINWGAVAGFLKTAAGFAGQLVTWFSKMPDWAQAFLIGGFAVTKLPVIGSIVSELGKGLIKGVLGMTAGVVNINAGVVNGGGAPVPGGGKGGGIFGGKGVFNSPLKIALGLTGVGLAAMLAEEFSDEISGLGSDLGFAWRDVLKTQLGISIPTIRIDQLEWPFGPKNTPTILPEIFGGNGILGGTPGKPAPVTGGDRPSPGNPGLVKGQLAEAIKPTKQAVTNAIENSQSIASRENSAQKNELSNVKNAVATMDTNQKAAIVAQTAVTTAGNLLSVFQSANQVLAAAGTTTAARNAGINTASAARNAGTTTAAAMSAAAGRIVAAVYGARPIIQPTNVIEHYTTTIRTGNTSGSRRSGPLP